MLRDEAVRHANLIQSAIQSGGAASSALVASWRRSATLHRLDPTERRGPRRLSDSELAAARQRLGPVLRIAEASLDRLHFAVGGLGCCVLLADLDSVPLERRGVAGDDSTFEEWGLWPGCVWSEESEGTNGIGTCLVEQRLVTIDRDQHFLTRNTTLTCTTAPIYDHEGRLVAALDVSSCRADLTAGLANLITIAVGEAARRIEIEIFRQAFANARFVVPPGGEPASASLVAIDKDGVVIGATRAARQAFRHRGNIIGSPLPVAEDAEGAPRFEDELRLAGRGILERALVRHDGNVTAAARQLGMSRATLYRKLEKVGLARPN